MIMLGLLILAAAVVIGVAGVLSNRGSGHELTGGFSVLGVDVTGSTGTLFLCGIVVGAAALLGLSLILTGTRRTVRRRRPAHRGRRASAREPAAAEQERGGLHNERDTARAQPPQAERDDADLAGPAERPRRKQHWFHSRAAPH
ncbi:hypothetical protein RB628_31120 [Streptomyces sp. ADMS]|uniref:hypothetical protein n=1 Tax=Streptomyces sp. ADMS TaxID=3071415 RepID=UPI00296F518A|nr:hypothetical protein [Streptomyces sp. ADMS]MDW4909673.1 hypothetical protein [Streptomyces sp. ADMS]